MPRFNVVLQVKLVVETDNITDALNEMEYSFDSGNDFVVIHEEIVDYQVNDVWEKL